MEHAELVGLLGQHGVRLLRAVLDVDALVVLGLVLDDHPGLQDLVQGLLDVVLADDLDVVVVALGGAPVDGLGLLCLDVLRLFTLDDDRIVVVLVREADGPVLVELLLVELRVDLGFVDLDEVPRSPLPSSVSMSFAMPSLVSSGAHHIGEVAPIRRMITAAVGWARGSFGTAARRASPTHAPRRCLLGPPGHSSTLVSVRSVPALTVGAPGRAGIIATWQ